MAKIKTIYIDSCIFISCFMKEKEVNKKISDFFQDSKNLNINFVTSDWTLTEIVKVLIKSKTISSKKVVGYIEELKRTKRVNGLKFNWIQVSRKDNYDFEEFFYDVQKIQLQYKGSLGDAIHAVIMKNNSINTILTTDSEFDGMKGMIVMNPLNLKENRRDKNARLRTKIKN